MICKVDYGIFIRYCVVLNDNGILIGQDIFYGNFKISRKSLISILALIGKFNYLAFFIFVGICIPETLVITVVSAVKIIIAIILIQFISYIV